ncbi:transcription initiation factor IIE alpha subunit [Bacillus sp. SORGH_AS 510]|uniref:DNA-binding protein n=1 Tax=Bacillus sp. SORGH_AS_0510 TaxID=3041771 RepID=UPI00278545C3|nr:DNA-binding protein [Bacillus sp. SORGH_AS_0510]MDQ1146127.1 transcription initiation factor IIE alpha subunit [Bacillus sp. SORGH_AS_0510]
MNQPTVSEIINRLDLVLTDRMTREEVSGWASYYVMADNRTIDDEIVWELLKIISGIDILDSPKTYLHNEEDIKDWIKNATKSLLK